MTDRTIALTRRRLLGGVGTIAAASAATGAGTMAYFSDNETSSGNTIQAGTIDLTLEGESESYTFFENTGAIAPGDSDSDTVEIGNDGSIAADLRITLDDVTDAENGYDGGEEGQNDSSEEGELSDHLELRVVIDGQDNWDWFPATQLHEFEGNTFSQMPTIEPGSTIDFTIHWSFNETSSNGNDINLAQGDSFEFSLAFELVQNGGG